MIWFPSSSRTTFAPSRMVTSNGANTFTQPAKIDSEICAVSPALTTNDRWIEPSLLCRSTSCGPGARSSTVNGVIPRALPSSTTCAPAGSDVSSSRPVVAGLSDAAGRGAMRDPATTESSAVTAARAFAVPVDQYAFTVTPTAAMIAAAPATAIQRPSGTRSDRARGNRRADAARAGTVATGAGTSTPAVKSSSSGTAGSQSGAGGVCGAGRPNATTTGRTRFGAGTGGSCGGGAWTSSGESLQAARLARIQLAAACAALITSRWFDSWSTEFVFVTDSCRGRRPAP